MSTFYLPASGQVLSDTELLGNTGFPPTYDPGVLASNGIYTVVPTPDPYDPDLYTSTAVYTIVGYNANQSWTSTPLPLATAQENGIIEVKAQADLAETTVLADNNITANVMTAVAGQLIGDRPASLQTILAEMQTVSDNLGSQITAIDSATTVDEINNIVNPPTGTLFTGRGAGLGPEDLNESYYTSFNSVSMTEADTELYVPGTATVIPYGIPNPGEFDSLGNCFNVGDYLIQIRETATSMVIAEFEVPLNLVGEDVSF